MLCPTEAETDMNAKLDPTLIPAFDAIFGTDSDVARFKRLCANDAEFREQIREEEPAVERDAAEFFAAEQCPSDSNFR